MEPAPSLRCTTFARQAANPWTVRASSGPQVLTVVGLDGHLDAEQIPDADLPARSGRGLSVGEGESAVFTPGDAGRSSLVARITVEEWQMWPQQG